MEILITMYSDYNLLNKDDFEIITAIPQGYYYMRSHPTMSEENRNKEEVYLHIKGN